jgi:hypothetical protein
MRNVAAGRACVTKYQDIYHRVYVVARDHSNALVHYVDFGLTALVRVEHTPFKQLLEHFTLLPRMSIECRLLDIDFQLVNGHISDAHRRQFLCLCQVDVWLFEVHSKNGETIDVRTRNVDGRCLSDELVARGIAVGEQ